MMQENLLILRKRCGYSIKYVAEYLGISSKQYSAKENGLYPFNSDEMFKLSELFNKRMDDIFLPRSHHFGDLEKTK